jgi:CHASE3 domain sensor protein
LFSLFSSSSSSSFALLILFAFSTTFFWLVVFLLAVFLSINETNRKSRENFSCARFASRA